MSGTDYSEQAARISKELDYEEEALEGLRRSWELEDRECQALALSDAQVFAPLHLARTIRETSEQEEDN